MKNWYFVALFLAITPGAIAQGSSTLDKTTTVSFKETTIDYGTIEKGADGIKTFTFTNTGKNPFKIYQIYSSCSCDIVSQPEKEIAPGATGEIKVKYDTNKLGPIVKTITANANVADKLIPLNLKGRVIPKKESSQEEDEDKIKL